MTTTIVSADGAITIPAEFRIEDRIEAGQAFEIERLGAGLYRLVKKMAPRGDAPKKLVDVLLECPVKGFFVSMDRTEMTDSIVPPPFE